MYPCKSQNRNICVYPQSGLEAVGGGECFGKEVSWRRKRSCWYEDGKQKITGKNWEGKMFVTKNKERNSAVGKGLMLASNKNSKKLLLFLGTASQLWGLTKGKLISGELPCWTPRVLGQMLLVWHEGQLRMLLCFLECHLNWGAQFFQCWSIIPHKCWNPFSWLWAGVAQDFIFRILYWHEVIHLHNTSV